MTFGGASPLKPQPRIDAISAPFWDACNEERVLLQKCEAEECNRFIYYPRVCCPYCQKPNLTWYQVSGRGRVLTHTTVHRPHHEGFYPKAPYVFAAVEMDEGPLIYGTITDAPIEARLIGCRVRAGFVQHGPTQKLLIFELDD